MERAMALSADVADLQGLSGRIATSDTEKAMKTILAMSMLNTGTLRMETPVVTDDVGWLLGAVSYLAVVPPA